MTDKIDFEIVHIPLRNLSVVWAKSQRPLDEKWANKIAEEFDPDKYDPICVTKPNGAGVYHIIEGQHRKAAVEKLWGPNEKVPCRIIAEADPARAAEIWLGINQGRKKIRPTVEFTVAVEAKRPVEVAINNIVRRAGYKVGDNTKGDNTIAAVGSLKSVYNQYGEDILRYTLNTCRLLWGADPHGVSAPMINGIGMFLNEFHSHVDASHLKKVISQYPSPWKFVDAVKLVGERSNDTLPVAMSELIRTKYNKSQRVESKKLRRKED